MNQSLPALRAAAGCRWVRCSGGFNIPPERLYWKTAPAAQAAEDQDPKSVQIAPVQHEGSWCGFRKQAQHSYQNPVGLSLAVLHNPIVAVGAHPVHVVVEGSLVFDRDHLAGLHLHCWPW